MTEHNSISSQSFCNAFRNSKCQRLDISSIQHALFKHDFNAFNYYFQPLSLLSSATLEKLSTVSCTWLRVIGTRPYVIYIQPKQRVENCRN